MRSIPSLTLPTEISDGRVDTILKAFHLLKNPDVKELHLNWQRTTQILPAGSAILACLFDSAVEQQKSIKNTFIKKHLQKNRVVQNLIRLAEFLTLPKPQINEFATDQVLLGAGERAINISFIEKFQEFFGSQLSEDLEFSCQLVFNELMQNSVDHATAERYYLYAGPWQHEFHVGVLDMGCTIPAKLEQKYTCDNDLHYLAHCFKEGVSTRRQRLGGLGLSHVFDLLKNHGGTLTVLSRDAQIRRYFKNRVVQRSVLKHSLRGTWCFTRFPLEKRS